MKRKELERPPRNPRFCRGEIVNWKMRDKIIFKDNRYCVRFVLWFADGSSMIKESGGFKTKTEALDRKNELVVLLTSREYVATETSVSDFFGQWLYYYMIDERHITYATYMSYRNIIYNYIIPKIGDMKLEKVTTNTILSILDLFSSDSLLTMGYAVFGSSFKYAKRMGLVRLDYADIAISIKRKQRRKEKMCEAARDPLPVFEKKRRYSMTAKQICSLLYLAKTEDPDFYLPLLLACTTGCRISELIALRFCDVDYKKKCIHINGQLSRPVDISDIPPEENVLQRLKTKSAAGIRSIPVPDFVLDEIILAKERYRKIMDGKNVDTGYLWHKEGGAPHNRRDYKIPFERLKEKMHLPEDFHWHDLRHTFATIMAENEVNLKELANVLGHRTGEFTHQVYVEQKPEIYEGVSQYFDLLETMTGIRTDKTEDICQEKTVHNIEGYMAFLESVVRDAIE